MRQEKLYLFETDLAQRSGTENFLMRDVARATSAAPTYFEAANINGENSKHNYCFVDGGLIANNPSMAAYARAQALFPNARKITLLSLGTGQCPQDNLSEIKGGLLGWGPIVASVMMDGVSDFNHSLLKDLAENPSIKDRFNYIRLQPMLTKKRSELDTVSEENINYLIAIAKNTVKEHKLTLSQIADRLADTYEERGYFLFPDIMKSLKVQLKTEQEISLENFKINEIGAWEIATYLRKQHSNHLTILNLAKNNLKDQGVHLLLQIPLPSLKELNLQANQITSKGGVTSITHLTSLRSLNISENPIYKEGIVTVAKSFPNLTFLDVSAIGLDDDSIDVISTFLTQLTTIYAENRRGHSDNTFTLKGSKTLLQKLPYLCELSISRMKKNTAAVQGVIEGINGSPSLTSLNLSHTELDDSQLNNLINALRLRKTFSSLNLRHNPFITRKGIEFIASWLKEGSALRFLDISNSFQMGEGIYKLAEALESNRNLTTLHLEGCITDDKGLTSLFKSLLNNITIKELFLGNVDLNTVITDLTALKQTRNSLGYPLTVDSTSKS